MRSRGALTPGQASRVCLTLTGLVAGYASCWPIATCVQAFRLGHTWCGVYPLSLLAPVALMLALGVAVVMPVFTRSVGAMVAAILVASLGGIAAVVTIGMTTDLGQPLFAVHRLALGALGLGMMSAGCLAALRGIIDPRADERSAWAGAFVLLAVIASIWVIVDPHLQHVPDP